MYANVISFFVVIMKQLCCFLIQRKEYWSLNKNVLFKSYKVSHWTQWWAFHAGAPIWENESGIWELLAYPVFWAYCLVIILVLKFFLQVRSILRLWYQYIRSTFYPCLHQTITTNGNLNIALNGIKICLQRPILLCLMCNTNNNVWKLLLLFNFSWNFLQECDNFSKHY